LVYSDGAWNLIWREYKGPWVVRTLLVDSKVEMRRRRDGISGIADTPKCVSGGNNLSFSNKPLIQMRVVEVVAKLVPQPNLLAP